jgi:osmotically-inducible protein OsmY
MCTGCWPRPAARCRPGKALDRNALVPDDSDVQVDTSGSTVILTGHVRIRAERDAVVGVAWMARGVAIVVDELKFTG